jgi:hypothetical protein
MGCVFKVLVDGMECGQDVKARPVGASTRKKQVADAAGGKAGLAILRNASPTGAGRDGGKVDPAEGAIEKSRLGADAVTPMMCTWRRVGINFWQCL